ncbi:MAG: 4-alpha-glucanotransferase [Actinomycetota bacterium]|nr:4-alpha-glucanotransferase [Actinomycetota bacterium]
MTTRRSEASALRRLAKLHGVQTSYEDVTHVRRRASDEALLAALRALGAPVESMADVGPALEEEADVERVTPLVAWDGVLGLPPSARGRVLLEDGSEAPLDARLPFGYHRTGAGPLQRLVISAPSRCYEREDDHGWGVFLPLYALRTARDWGAGDLTDLTALMEWMQSLGGGVVGTLPMLAAFLDEPFEPSPYSPVSRMFWNELYVDVERAPELERSPKARRLLASKRFRDDIAAARRKRHVDYRLVASLKRRVLEHLADVSDDVPSGVGRERLGQVQEYARFRAAVERFGPERDEWPFSATPGKLRAADLDPAVVRYHTYVQLLAERQFKELDRRSEGGDALFLDLPLGVHPDGYDAWRHQHVFAQGVTGGAPPDPFFSEGQNWGFAPLNPRALREGRSTYPIACLRHLMRHASLLRIDHVMWMHRLFWVPEGMGPKEGVYVTYPHEELYAVLAVESHRARTVVVGEDLGTVPKEVRRTMKRRGVRRSYVLQYELRPEHRVPLGRVPESSQASLNTHDMPPFAAIWDGLDIDDRVDLGLFDAKGAREERAERSKLKRSLAAYLRSAGLLAKRATSGHDAMVAALRYLARSESRTVLVNLEDLWDETRPQNTPGTSKERRNWVRKARHPFERFREMPEVLGTLQEVSRDRGTARATTHEEGRPWAGPRRPSTPSGTT